MKTVTKDQNKGRFFNVICPSVPHESNVKRGRITCREGSSLLQSWGEQLLPCLAGYLKELPRLSVLCSGMAVGSGKA